MEVIYRGHDQDFDFGDGKGTQRETSCRNTLLCGIRIYFDQTRGQRNVTPEWDWKRDEQGVKRWRIATPKCAITGTTGGNAAGVEEWPWRQQPQCILVVVGFLPLEQKGCWLPWFSVYFPDLFRQTESYEEAIFSLSRRLESPEQLSFVLGEYALKFHRAERNCRVCSSFVTPSDSFNCYTY